MLYTLVYMYYLIHEKERFIIFIKQRSAAERFRYDKVLSFYTDYCTAYVFLNIFLKLVNIT